MTGDGPVKVYQTLVHYLKCATKMNWHVKDPDKVSNNAIRQKVEALERLYNFLKNTILQLSTRV